MSKKVIRVAVIDDGINEKLYNISDLEYNIEITSSLEINKREDYNPYSASHGTTCAAIICKYAANVILSSVKILNNNCVAIKEQLIKAIEWCIDNSINIINLSLGTINYKDFSSLKKVINIAYEKGVIIVAACNNSNVFTYPASHTNVIGVRCDRNDLLDEGELIYNYYAFDGIEITACGKHLLHLRTGENKYTKPTNSYSAPLITAIIYNILSEQNSKMQLKYIKEKLKEKSKSEILIDYKNYLCHNVDWLDNPAIFMLGKNSNCYIPDIFSNIFSVDCIDEQTGLKYIMEFWSSYQGALPNSTVICVDKSMQMAEHEVLCDFFEFLCSMNINVVYINDKCRNENILLKDTTYDFKIWHPVSSKLFLNNSEICGEIDNPIILIFNNTNKPLNRILYKLLNLFSKDGYNAVAASNKCDGILSSIEYIDVSSIRALNLINKTYNPDLILLGIDLVIENSDIDIIKQIENAYDIDIRIFITDTNINSKSNVEHLNDDIFLFWNEEECIDVSNENQNVFMYNDESVESLYSHIINIYSIE